jgi:hypothetical protein
MNFPLICEKCMGGNFWELMNTIENHTKDSFHTYKPFFFFVFVFGTMPNEVSFVCFEPFFYVCCPLTRSVSLVQQSSVHSTSQGLFFLFQVKRIQQHTCSWNRNVMMDSVSMKLLAFVFLLLRCQRASLALAVDFQGMAMAFNVSTK